jgi:hypothetical protein
MQTTTSAEARNAIREELARYPGRARFIVEIEVSLAARGIEKNEAETTLVAMERDGTLLVRANACADPHLADADLRLAALIEHSPCDCEDSMGAAVIAIEKTWKRWLEEYLANHRCT